jgi:hypothetical protein
VYASFWYSILTFSLAISRRREMKIKKSIPIAFAFFFCGVVGRDGWCFRVVTHKVMLCVLMVSFFFLLLAESIVFEANSVLWHRQG